MFNTYVAEKGYVKKNIHHTDNNHFLWERGRGLAGRVFNKKDFSLPVNLIFIVRLINITKKLCHIFL